MDGLALNEWWGIRQEYLKQFCGDIPEFYLMAVESIYGQGETFNEMVSTRREIAIVSADLRSVPGTKIRKKRWERWKKRINKLLERDLNNENLPLEEKILSFRLYEPLLQHSNIVLSVTETFHKRIKKGYEFLVDNGFLNFELMGARKSFNALVSYNSGLATLVVSYISEAPLIFMGNGYSINFVRNEPITKLTYLEWDRLE